MSKKYAITDINNRQRLWAQYIQDKYRERDKWAFRKILHSEAGRWFYIRLLEMTRYQGQSFTGNSQTFYNEGMRSVGIKMNEKLMDLLGVDGFKQKQTAEREYVKFQQDNKVLFEREDD